MSPAKSCFALLQPVVITCTGLIAYPKRFYVRQGRHSGVLLRDQGRPFFVLWLQLVSRFRSRRWSYD
jgi:hypothetical protein